MSIKPKKEATLLHALIPILFLVVVLFITIVVFEQDPHIPLIMSTIVAGLVAVFMLGFNWTELEEGIIDTIKMGMQAVLILMVIGTIIGTWILSGTVPTMIYYGLQILSPGIFLIATVLICCIVSISTGSSWTTAGTVGIALLGVGTGLGMPVGMVAGAIVSGAYFGDKMSPLSDTTNLAPAMAGTTLFEHIKHMVYTTGPALLISLVIYGILGLKYSGQSIDTAQINLLLGTISQNFNITPLLLIPPIVVILIVVMKVPALPGLITGTLLGSIFAVLFQGADFGAIIDAAHYGFEIETGVEIVDELLSGGGLDGMMWTVSLILIALAFGGVMERTGMLHAVGRAILSLANGTGSLILATVVTCIFVNLVTGEQYLSIVVPGRMYKDAYAERGIHPKVLSRALEGSGTVTSALIPWNTCGAFMMGVFNVSPLVYGPYAFLNLLLPVINVVYGYLGITITKIDKTEKATA
ncbi:Na+/H+ antiporter NhaC [Alkaliphilus peptidifermentans]|uniref:Na+:H+ antiporter, NhaC family n=1 Tax=Alkaliphilus peptidifermentans DSM 18978 TaxID=1120976 RepID=A0A1G5FNT5_9FIRM|nr:Na+/H+ antiporter NhaC [Alkaliphilus peptidifermentans]SCY40945.1 Na+:H+ antiporter, NhaC family [Alkaliphilus peptidifermentans DSM 18978]